MLLHIGQLRFFDPSLIPSHIFIISAFRVLEEHGLPGLLDLLRREVQAREATVLVLDGVISIQETAGSPSRRNFFMSCKPRRLWPVAPYFFLAAHKCPRLPSDIRWSTALFNFRRDCMVDVRSAIWKYTRCVGPVLARRAFLSDHGSGVDCLPSNGGVAQNSSGPPTIGSTIGIWPQTARPYGGGGFPSNSTALLAGPAGVGKTTLGLHFLSQCNEECPGLHFGFYEQPEAISMKVDALGLPLKGLLEQEQVEVLWQPTTEGILDEACHRLLDAIRRRGVRRLFIDGLEGFERLTTDRERLGHVFAALSNELSVLGVTTLYTAEAEAIGPVSGLPISHVPCKAFRA